MYTDIETDDIIKNNSDVLLDPFDELIFIITELVIN